MGHNLFRLTDEQQIRYVAKLCGFNDQANLKDLPTAQLRDMIGKAENYAYEYLLGEIKKINKFANEYRELRNK